MVIQINQSWYVVCVFVCSAEVVVSFVEHLYHVKDLKGDIKYPITSSSMEKVKSVLGKP